MGFVIWLTGLPGSGKSTIANILKEKLEKIYKKEVIILDGDKLRKEFYPDLGFSPEEREFHNKVVIYLSKFLSENLDYIVIVSVIAPIRKVREYARKIIRNYIEVYLKADMETLIRRKPEIYKNHTAKFYEEGNPDLIINTEEDLESNIRKICEYIMQRFKTM